MKVLVTGGAGFIGSHIVENLLQRKDVSEVRVLDNFSTGYKHNLESFFGDPRFVLLEGDIRSVEDCMNAVQGVQLVCHQAALGSVPRSIQDPVTSHNVNVNGFLNILEAVRRHGVKKMVYASSSSVYGDLTDSPKVEHRTGKLLSPYAATKMTNELYAEVYAKTYNIQISGFRYFNVFGSRQDPNGSYAAVIPLFFKSAYANQRPVINGDGTITRDFTYVDNVVYANITALVSFENPGRHQVFNIACGESTSLRTLWNMIAAIAGTSQEPVFGPERRGDILHSLADISVAKQLLQYTNIIKLEEGLKRANEWYRALTYA